MQSRSDLWKSIVSGGDFTLETKAVIDGTDYTSISAPAIERALADTPFGIGKCVSATLRFSILTDDEIPASAEIMIRQRVRKGSSVSEWLPAGTFYISKREEDPVTGLLTFTCYDAMLKADKSYVPDPGEFPMTVEDFADLAAEEIGVDLDTRSAFPVITGSPVAYYSDMTLLEMMEAAAGICGGNFVITPEGKLRFVPLSAMNPEDESPAADPVTVWGVTGSIRKGNTCEVSGFRGSADGTEIMAGTDSGYVVDLGDNRYLTQAILASLLTAYSGYLLHPFEMSSAVYDPAAEVGDTVCRGNDFTSILYEESASLNTAFRGGIKAPESAEIQDEYPYKSKLASAIQKAESAMKAAEDASETASGKNAVFYQNGMPSGSGYSVNDIWFDTDGGNQMYYWNGSAWTAKQFGTTAIADGSITVDKMYVNSLSAITADLGAITAGSINIGNGKFTVGLDGTLQATGAAISGSITAYSGTIGGFTLEDGWMHSTHFILSPEGRTGETYYDEENDEWVEETYSWDDERRTTALDINGVFKVSTAGVVTAREGHLGSFILGTAGLFNEAYQTGISSSGTGAVSGALFFGERGYLGPTQNSFSGLIIGDYFKVSSNGRLLCSNGLIGVWEVSQAAGSLGHLISTEEDSQTSTNKYFELGSHSLSMWVDVNSTTTKSLIMNASGLSVEDISNGVAAVIPGMIYVTDGTANGDSSCIYPDRIEEKGVQLENKYLKLSGGTMSGNLQILNTTTTDPLRFRLANSARIGAVQVSNTGVFGLFDITDGKWLIYRNANGTIIPNATEVSARMTFSSAPCLNNNIYLVAYNNPSSGDATTRSLIGWSSGNNMWVGPYTFADRPNRITFGETIDKIYVYNSSGSQVLLSTAVSDERLKHDITDLQGARELIMSLTPKEFRYNGDDEERRHYGFVAQEVRPLIPDDSAILAYNPLDTETGGYDKNDEDTFEYSLSYTELIAPVIKVVQDQQKEIERLHSENQSLKDDLTELREMMAQLIEQTA